LDFGKYIVRWGGLSEKYVEEQGDFGGNTGEKFIKEVGHYSEIVGYGSPLPGSPRGKPSKKKRVRISGHS